MSRLNNLGIQMLALALSEGEHKCLPANYGEKGSNAINSHIKSKTYDRDDRTLERKILDTMGKREMTASDIKHRLHMQLEEVERVATQMRSGGLLYSEQKQGMNIYKAIPIKECEE
jgi:hypothetical protein